MNETTPAPDVLETLEAKRRQLEVRQPELAKGLEAFRTSYAAYQRMTEQFDAPTTADSSARAIWPA